MPSAPHLSSMENAISDSQASLDCENGRFINEGHGNTTPELGDRQIHAKRGLVCQKGMPFLQPIAGEKARIPLIVYMPPNRLPVGEMPAASRKNHPHWVACVAFRDTAINLSLTVVTRGETSHSHARSGPAEKKCPLSLNTRETVHIARIQTIGRSSFQQMMRSLSAPCARLH